MVTSSDLTEAYEIRQKNGLILIEWRDGAKLRRAWIRADQVDRREGKRLMVSRPSGGIPYGIDWARLIGPIAISSADLEQELKKAGIWTTDDLRTNPSAALGAIQSACGLTLASLVNAARQYDKDASGG